MTRSYADRSRSGGVRETSQSTPRGEAREDVRVMSDPQSFAPRQPSFGSREQTYARRSLPEQTGWHLWGMMVGFMAAGAAILIILSIKGG